MNVLYSELLKVLDYAKEQQEATKGEVLADVNVDYIRGVVKAAKESI